MAATVSPSDEKTSLAALLIGGMVCTGLTGVVCMQTLLYFRLFVKDPIATKTKVGAVFFIDLLHTIMVAIANFLYFVDHSGDSNITDRAFWAVGISIALTAFLTVFIHIFFALRLFKLSYGNYWITVPIILLAIGRLVSALVTTIELIRIGGFREFGDRFRWVFTLGLVLSSAVDFLITSGLCFYLRRSRTGTGRFDHILDSVALYTVETGLITSVTTIVSLIFWLTKPRVLIYLGLHFAISKLYANSFLASMNTRKILRAHSASQSGSTHRLPVIYARSGGIRGSTIEPVNFRSAVQITVDKTEAVDYGLDDLQEPTSGRKDASSPV